MTREEKVNTLKAIIQECEEYQWWRKATLSEIIEDLEYGTCEDCVSRKAVIKAVDSHTFETDGGLCLDDDISCILEELPPVTPTPKWIPVKERLPEESLNSVIGWDAYRERCVFVQYIDGHFQITGRNESFNIVAWQPLPKPYQEIESEQLLSYADQDTMQPAT